MRTKILAPRLVAFSRATALIAVAGFLSACSADAIRFEDALTTNTNLTDNQRAIIEKRGIPGQPFPGDEIQQEQPAYSAPSTRVERGEPLAPTVQRSELPAPTDSNGRVVLQPRTSQARPLRVLDDNAVTTGSIRESAPTPPAAPSPALKPVGVAKDNGSGKKLSPGWNKSKGTIVTVREGETLYNLSRRYGVPVRAIMKANVISDPAALTAGREILIPTYSYGKNAPVSAPDNNPRTKTASASRAVEAKAADAGDAIEESGGQLTPPTSGTVQIDPASTGSVPAREIKTAKVNKREQPQETINIAKRAEEKVSNPAKTASSSFRWPAKGRVITKFGERKNGTASDGIDISVPLGTPVKASENGTVIYSGSELQDFGKLVLLSHEGGWVSAYAHSSDVLVKRGDKVKRGQVIAKSGKSGNANVPKLHFELRKNSNPVNPLKHLAK